MANTPLTDEQLAEIRRRFKAKARPWKYVCDCEFAANSRADIPRLLDTVEHWKGRAETMGSAFTCTDCDQMEACPYAWDGYNVNGDCLANK